MGGYLLPAATFVFLIGFGNTLFAMGAGRLRPGRLNLVTMLAGFVLLSADLWLRGGAIHGCPITTLFDVLIFTSWAIVLIYIVIGSAYRLSLLGTFTSVLVLAILLVAQLAPMDRGAAGRTGSGPWVEFHAALSLISYGAFALAALAGVMYVLQHNQLKHRRGGQLLQSLPPISDLTLVNLRLLALGYGLLTISFAAGFVSGMPVNTVKFWTSAAIWVVYGLLLVMRRMHAISPRRVAALSIAIFVMAMLALPAIQHLSTAP